MDRVRLTKRRTSPCDRVFGDFTVSYDGTVFPCCQLFADAERHKQYAIGKLAAFGSIFEAYATSTFAAWRKSLLTHGEKEAPCDTCSECDEPVSAEEMTSRDSLYLELIGEPPPRGTGPTQAQPPRPVSRVSFWRRLSVRPGHDNTLKKI